jgi:hypothetical protein
LNVSPPSVTLAPGASATAQVSVTVTGGFSSLVSLSSSNVPAGLTAGFSSSSFAAPGSGSTVLTLNAASTAAAGPYTIYLTAAGGGLNQTVPLAVTIQSKCSYAINPTSAAPAAAGGNFTAVITTSNGCAWTASTAVNWINITSGASGTGNGTLYYSVLANSSTSSRAAAILVAGLSLPVTQSAASSNVPPLNPPSATFGAAGGRSSVTVTLPNPNAVWTATSSASWIIITSGASSNGGNKTVNYLVAANSGAQRSGYITIAGLALIVSQAGSSCSYGVSLGSMTAAPGGFNGTAKVSTSAPSCQWSAASNVSWIDVTSGSPGTGPGTVDFFVANNPNSSARVGDLTVAGFTIQVTEGAKGAVSLGKPVH